MTETLRYSMKDLAMRAGIGHNSKRYNELRTKLRRLGWQEVRARVPGTKNRLHYWHPINAEYDIVPLL